MLLGEPWHEFTNYLKKVLKTHTGKVSFETTHANKKINNRR